MKKLLSNIFLTFFLTTVFFAQTLSINSNSELKRKTDLSKSRILAVMVEFQTDKNSTTAGNGTFGSIYTKDYGNKIIDPLPHNKKYFENHLLFAKNYYSKVSKNKVQLIYTVLPDIITVSKEMKYYSPAINSKDFTNVVNFSTEVWGKVAEKNPQLDFSDYDIFIIFHAGVGRDINVPGSIGNEKDLPSVYLSLNAFKKVLGENFDGISVNNGRNKITNTIILPETQNREITTVTGKTLLKLSINGLIVSNIASYFGLPDLFDTNTGKSAIGRFGLMDGQAMFAYAGLFPPEPSAWEKEYLGFDSSKESNPNILNYNITTSKVTSNSDTTILKVPLNSSEYFLVENRQRDADKNGAIITYALGDKYFTKVFEKDTTGFTSFNVDSLRGVIVDVDEFDWALPGSGIAIWHIDNNVIKDKLPINKLNTDKHLRAIDLEEADGIQEIGEEFVSIFGDLQIGEGSKNDLWFKGNPEKLYKNVFTSTSFPNTKSNSLANTFISFYDFSSISNKMSFKLKLQDENIKVQNKIPFKNADDFTATENYYIIRKDNNVNVFSVEGSKIKTLNDFSTKKIAAIETDNDLILIGINGENLKIESTDFSRVVNLGNTISTLPVANKTNSNILIAIGTSSGSVYKIDFSISSGEISKELLTDLNEPVCQTLILNSEICAAGKRKIFFNNQALQASDNIVKIIATEFGTEKNLYILNSDNQIEKLGTNKAIIELQGSNQINDISAFLNPVSKELNFGYTSAENLYLINETGALVDYFPQIDYQSNSYIGAPIVANILGDEYPEIIVSTLDGRIHVYEFNDEKINLSLNISSGLKLSTLPQIVSRNNRPILAVIDSLQLSAWQVNTTDFKIFWSGKFANSMNNAVLFSNEIQKPNTKYFLADRTYNWPNPVYLNETNIRFYVSENSHVVIDIYDLSGQLVEKIETEAIGGQDNEVKWNVRNVQSGVYYANVKCNSASNSASKLIKIVVVK